MKIAINAPLKSDDIINLLNNYSENGVGFTFIKKAGLRLEFDVIGVGGEAACSLVKSLIKNSSFGKVLYFTVNEV